MPELCYGAEINKTVWHGHITRQFNGTISENGIVP